MNSSTDRGKFVTAISDSINKYKLDGVDIDWEYPTQGGGISSDKGNFINLLRELRAKLGTAKVITAAVGAGNGFIGNSYDVKGMNQYLTFINLMTYEYHGPNEKHTGQNSPLYASSWKGEDKSLNSDATVTAWINAGATPSKLLWD